jgi:hypothetical protein
VFSVSNGLYFLILPLVSIVHIIYTSKGMSKKFGGARYTLGARYLSKNTVIVREILCIWLAFIILYPISYVSGQLLAIHQISDCLCLGM